MPINGRMNPISLTASISSILAAQNTGIEISVATLKKTNDIAKAEGDALIQMLEDSLSQLNQHMLDIYA